MFDAALIIKNSDKEKLMHCGYGIATDGAGSWNFGNDLARNVVIVCVDNSTSFLVVGEGPTYGINGCFG